MNKVFAALSIWGAALCCAAPAIAAAPNPPFEIVKDHADVEVRDDGSYAESHVIVYRILTEQGAQALRQTTLSYSQSFQNYSVASAYTLKKNGTRIDVDPRSMLRGYGASNSPGFQDTQTITVVFPNVEVGDEISLTTLFFQLRPWFGNSFSEQFVFSRHVATHDVSIAITTPDSVHLTVDATGLTEAAPQSLNGKTRRTWIFENATPIEPEYGAVEDYDKGARLVVSSFQDFHEFAATYEDLVKDRATVTPDIRALADRLTAGLKGDREKARALYEWVSLHIAYVDIVLGAGGFVPHRASDVLKNQYGDCKDHVILLEALLSAEGISSTPVLINADNQFTLSAAPTQAAFNHLISYLPDLHLYLDSTARYAPFGVLPYSDAGKPVVHIADGRMTRTPTPSPADSLIRSVETLTIAEDGSIDGETHVTSTGAPAVDMRAAIAAIKAAGENTYFRQIMNPGVEATLDSGNVDDLTPTYSFTARYHEPNAINVPGPGTIPFGTIYKPFAFTTLLADDLPSQRDEPYQCMSMAAEEDLTIHLAPNLHFIALPRTETLDGEDMELAMTYDKPDEQTVHAVIKARVRHPNASCEPAYYARVHAVLAKMTSALRSEILYQ